MTNSIPGPWRIISDPSCKTLAVARWKQAERNASGFLSSEREVAPVRFRTRRAAVAWIVQATEAEHLAQNPGSTEAEARSTLASLIRQDRAAERAKKA